jgi:hypothetical protein
MTWERGKSLQTMDISYSIYKLYRGEKENPFDQVKRNTEHMFWFFESTFAMEFAKNDSSDWFNFFDEHDLGDRFMKILEEKDHDRPGEDKKKQIFELWLDYLFTFKLYPEYGGKNEFQTAYRALTAR